MMEEMDDLDVESVSSDYSILPEAHEMDGVAQPYLATRPDANSSISSHTQVEFVNMCSSYPSSQDLVLCYTFTAEHVPSVTDRLALYKVGFTTPQDYLVYEWAPMQPQAAPSSDAADGRIFCVTFSKSGLPGDANEFYQVCYLSEDRLIRGVSAPFQLVQDGSAQSSLSSGAVSSIEQPDGTVLVTTDVSCLHTNINMLQACVQRVQAEKVAVEEQLAAVQLQLQGKTEQLRDLQLKIQDLSVAADKQQQASAAALLEAESRLSSLQQERNALQESLQAAQDEVDRLQEEIKLQVRHNDDVLKTLSQREENLAEKTAQLHEKQEQLATAMNQLQALEAKQEANEELRQQMEEQQEQKLLLEKTRDELQQTKQELEEEQSKLVSVQTSLDACREELRVATERQKVLNADNKVLQDSVRSHLRYSAQLKLKLREAEGACAGAERVARQLSEQFFILYLSCRV
ncbi:tropomyosin [Hyalella azteca]|uniref:Tropomyosin n=1 Tax=Hyalella azteca TaxID=294128 RepID=A0A8B7P108_HYAAZ|nr:tropomyosin [Hyalella azteca]